MTETPIGVRYAEAADRVDAAVRVLTGAHPHTVQEEEVQMLEALAAELAEKAREWGGRHD
jgi:hypothetical protein